MNGILVVNKPYGYTSRDIVNIVSKTFNTKKNFVINNIDFLKVKIEQMIEEINKSGYKDIVVLSNLPYYITSKLLNRILKRT